MARRDSVTPVDIFYRRKKWNPNSQPPLLFQISTPSVHSLESEEEISTNQEGFSPPSPNRRTFSDGGEENISPQEPLNRRLSMVPERMKKEAPPSSPSSPPPPPLPPPPSPPSAGKRKSSVIPDQKLGEGESQNEERANVISMTQAGFVVNRGSINELQEEPILDEEVRKLSGADPSSASLERRGGNASASSLPKIKSQRSFVAFANQRASSNTKRGMLSKNEMTLKERFVQFFRLPSLRVVFTLANAFILLLSVGVMILFTILRANSVKDNLSQTLSDSITQRATFYFTEILDSSLLTTFEASRFVSLNLTLTNNSDAMARYLLDILNRSPTVDQVFIGDHNGMFALAGRRLSLNSTFVSWVTKPLPEAQGKNNRVQYFVNDACSPLNLSCSITGALMEESAYDPRVRGWYIEAATSNRSWTDIYFNAAYKDGSIAGYDPFFLGNDLIFVSSVGITLSRLKVFLDILFLELGDLEAAFLVTDHSEIVACSSVIPEDSESCRFVLGTNYTSNSTVPDIIAADSIFDWNRILTNTSLEYQQEDDIIWAARGFQSKGLKWVMVVKISRKQIVGNSETLVFLVAPLVGVGLLILSLIITYWLTKRITVPLKRVTKKLLAVSNLEIDPASRIIETQSRIKEVNEIETATTTLIFGLRSFSKYVPQEIVKILLQLKREATLGLDEADISIFFSDIANFTTIAETISARELVSLLGEYLMEMSAIIQVSGGVVDKYIGDAVMAFWNAPNMVVNHELVACEAAINSQVRLAELREAWRESGFPIIQARIGINSGKARVGNIGSSTRFNYTCIGDNVNLASRLEGLNKIYGTSIIVSGVVHDKVRKTYLTRLLDLVAVKGKSKAVRIYELIGKRADFPEERVESCNLFRKAFELYLSRDFEAAIKLFHQFNEQFPSDHACLRHLENCQKYLISPPPPNWDGVAKMEEK